MKQYKCSMSKKIESLNKKAESANSDYSFSIWSARHPETEKGPTRFIYVGTPSSSSGWYDVSKEYVDSYEEEMNRRNGNINYQYVAKKVMDMIVSGAIKPCKDPFDTIPNFSRWFKEYPFFISTSQQDILDGKYSTRSESKKSEGISDMIDAKIDYNMFMRMCKTAAYLEEDEDYWDALWEYYSDVGSIGDALVFFDNLFQYTSWKTAKDLWTDYSNILGDKPEGKDYEEALDAYLDENDNEVGKSAVYKYGNHYLMLH